MPLKEEFIMKTDRLYAFTLHLLNHGKTPASELAKLFEVSVRTIQRDVESLCQAGIPVIAETGSTGGYYLPEHFKMDKQTASEDDYRNMLTALHGLATATNDSAVRTTIEKLTAVSNTESSPLVLDFSVLREGDEALMQLLKTAILEKRKVEFHYTNANNIARLHAVEPVALVYRWYAWYLLAYSNIKNDYRTYKLVRMRDVVLSPELFIHNHPSVKEILANSDTSDTRTYIKIRLRCNAQAKTQVTEYLKAAKLEKLENGDFIMEALVVENEQFWFGMFLSLSDSVEILEPQNIRERVISAARKLLFLYGEL
jgi:predicted DNA-binding transcriptional regulator YafY